MHIASYLRYLIARYIGFSESPHKVRRRIGAELYRALDGRIGYGRFQGLIVPEKLIWGKNDLPSMLLGLYELEIQRYLRTQSKEFEIFIDIGSADGYYLSGIMNSKIAKKAISFEVSNAAILKSIEFLKLNNLENVVEFRGPCNAKILEDTLIELDSNRRILVLCDVEGAEFEIFQDSVIRKMSNCDILIEIHSKDVNVIENFISRFRFTHNVKILENETRNPNDLSELDGYSDDERYVICSEGREYKMSWMIAQPLNASSQPQIQKDLKE